MLGKALTKSWRGVVLLVATGLSTERGGGLHVACREYIVVVFYLYGCRIWPGSGTLHGNLILAISEESCYGLSRCCERPLSACGLFIRMQSRRVLMLHSFIR